MEDELTVGKLIVISACAGFIVKQGDFYCSNNCDSSLANLNDIF